MARLRQVRNWPCSASFSSYTPIVYSNGKANTWGYSTNAQANTLIANLRSPQVRTAEFDDNRDGKVDRLELSVLLPLNAGDRIHGFETILYHDVRLSQRAKVLFDAISYANYESGTGMESLEIDGELSLNQRWPFNVYGGYRRWYEDDKLFDISTTTSAQDIQMDRLLKRSNARNGESFFFNSCSS